MQIPPLTLGRFPAIAGRDWLLIFISIAAALIYFATIPWHPYPGIVFIKALAVSPLALLVFLKVKDREGLILTAGLVFSTLGDIFLAIDPERTFVFGLGAFLVAHLFYILLFAGRARGRTTPPFAFGLCIALVIFSGVMIFWLWPSLGDLAIPVVIYIAVITVMGITALIGRFAEPWVAVGAILFIFSDSVIAVTRFKELWLVAGPWLIWSMYYMAQYLIALGFLRDKLLRPPDVYVE